MKFFLDENIPLSIASLLSSLGHSAGHVRNTNLVGASDSTIARYAKEQKAVLITKDLDFGNLILYPKGLHYGLLIIRLPFSFSAFQIFEHLSDFFKIIEPSSLVGSLTILELGRYRMRKL